MKKNITINIDRLTDKIEIFTDNNSRNAIASQEEMIHQSLKKGIGLIFSHSRWYPEDQNPFNALHKKTSLRNHHEVPKAEPYSGKLNADEWSLLKKILENEVPQQALRDFYHQLLELPGTYRGKYLKKKLRQMREQMAEKNRKTDLKLSSESSPRWSRNFV